MSNLPTTWNLELAKQYFAERGCELLETEYKDYSTPMRYVATCGHEHTITMNNFRQGKGDLCRACRYKAVARKEQRLTVEKVRDALEAEDCDLLDEEILGWTKPFHYVARCGHENKTTFSHWTEGGGRVCAKCSKSIRYTKEYVASVFAALGCELLSEYTNCKTPVRYRDMFGKVRTTSFDHFLNGRNTRDRESGMPPWRQFIFSRDDFTCQVCGKRGGDLEAHHLMSYADNSDLRSDLENGVTMCKTCHRSFHKAKGFGKNTREQYEEWRREYRGKAEN